MICPIDARAQLQPVLRAQGDQTTGGGNKAPGVDTRDEVAVFARAAEALERARRLEGAAVRVSVYGIDHLICLVGVVPGVHHKNCNTTFIQFTISLTRSSPGRMPWLDLTAGLGRTMRRWRRIDEWAECRDT